MPTDSTDCPAPRGPVFLLICVVLLATAALMLSRYRTESTAPPAPPGALGMA